MAHLLTIINHGTMLIIYIKHQIKNDFTRLHTYSIQEIFFLLSMTLVQTLFKLLDTHLDTNSLYRNTFVSTKTDLLSLL